MRYEERWKVERTLGKGGQGEVHLVEEVLPDDTTGIKTLFKRLAVATQGVSYANERERAQQHVVESLAKLIASRSNVRRGALKVLHRDEQARDAKRARERAAHEIATMRKWSHPNLLRLLDYDGEELWYVSEFHDRGTLDKHLQRYSGNLPLVLTTVRPLVEGVALLHRNKVVHRDIKPQNIFLSGSDELILGDFGLVYVSDPAESRISAKHSNVGTHAWMPGWAMEKRVDEVTPAFDVFSLGKVIWSMLSGRPVLPLWYYQQSDSDVAKIFPDDSSMELANRLFAQCIVEHEEDCLPDAARLLEVIESTLGSIYQSTPIAAFRDRTCRVCGHGSYIATTSGTSEEEMRTQVVTTCRCDHCGHLVQFVAQNTRQSLTGLHVKAKEVVSQFTEVDDALGKLARDFERLWLHEIEQKRPTSGVAKDIADNCYRALSEVVQRFGSRLPADVVTDIKESQQTLTTVYSTYRSFGKTTHPTFLERIAGIRKRLEIHSDLT